MLEQTEFEALHRPLDDISRTCKRESGRGCAIFRLDCAWNAVIHDFQCLPVHILGLAHLFSSLPFIAQRCGSESSDII
jgi:hypothetical protein